MSQQQQSNQAIGNVLLVIIAILHLKIHVENALESQFGKDNFKVIEDTNAGFLDNRFFVSLKKDDGSFTSFTNPTQDILTMAQKYIPALGYEVVADVAAVGTSLVASGVATTLTSMIPGFVSV